MIRIPKYFIHSAVFLALLVVFAQTTQAAAAASPNNGQQQNVPEGSSSSLNWSGYVATDDSAAGYTSATGSWVVPTVSRNAGSSADATWVGIGGVQSRDLIQAGTQALVQDGTVVYSAWIETLPGYSKTVPLTVNPGDSVTATVTEESPGQWLVTINNNTRSTSYSRTVAYDSSRSSAEWVEEMVSNGSASFIPLDSFGSVAFTNTAATVNGTSKNLAQLSATPLQMLNGTGQILATTSSIGSDSTSFSVARSDTSASPLAQQYFYYSTGSIGSGTPVTVLVRHHRHTYTVDTDGGSYTVVSTPFGFSISF